MCDPAGSQTTFAYDAFGSLAAQYSNGALVIPYCTRCYLSTDQIGKNQPYRHAHPEYADFGNFNYGATGNALGVPTSIVLRGAGYAQSKAGTSTSTWGHWWGSAPYGDDPEDQQQIKNGIQYAQEECN